MNFAWLDFLKLAEEWATLQTANYPDALHRSIISRAYYAVFHSALDLAHQQGLETNHSSGDHYRVRSFFNEYGRGNLATQLSFALRTLYDLRADADYNNRPNNRVSKSAKNAAKEALDVAHKAMELIGYLQAKTK